LQKVNYLFIIFIIKVKLKFNNNNACFITLEIINKEIAQLTTEIEINKVYFIFYSYRYRYFFG